MAATLEDPDSDPHPDLDTYFIFFLFLPSRRTSKKATSRRLRSSILQSIFNKNVSKCYGIGADSRSYNGPYRLDDEQKIGLEVPRGPGWEPLEPLVYFWLTSPKLSSFKGLNEGNF